MTRLSTTAAVAAVAATVVLDQTSAHMMQMFPISRQYSYGPVFKEWDDPVIDYCPMCYNARGPKYVQARGEANTDPEVLAKYGDGAFPLPFAPFAENGNYLEPQAISVRHGVCGDPEQNAAEGTNVYSTPNSNWPVIDSFKGGQVIEIDTIMNAYHWGHCEYFICDTADLADPMGVATQECFNMHPLTRAPDDGSASPIDPNYPGRYYVDPECRENETEQGKPEKAPKGYNIKMRYVLPNIECDHCVLQMIYYTGNSCKHIGYDEFEPDSWPSQCAPNKSDWIEQNRRICGEPDAPYPEEFWACSDISITSDGSAPKTTPAPIPSETPAPVTETILTPAPVTVTSALVTTKETIAPTPSLRKTPAPIAGTEMPVAMQTILPVGGVEPDTPSPVSMMTEAPVGGGNGGGKTTPSPVSAMTDAPAAMTTASPATKETPAPVSAMTGSPVGMATLAPASDGGGATPAPVTTTSTIAPVYGGGDGTPSPTIGSSTVPDDDMQPGTYEHLGCFVDMKDDRILGHPIKSDDMTPDVCMEHCNINGAAYMANQYGHECWCSKAGNLNYERHGGVGVCDAPCAGDEAIMCGGTNAFDLYKLAWAEASTDPEYMACYADKRDDRIMGNDMIQENMTQAVCREHCIMHEALYYATQYANECWCGKSDVFADYERHGPGVCHMGCAGDTDVACGGRNAFSLFRIIDDGTMPVDPTTTSMGSDDDFDTSSNATDPPMEGTASPVDPTDGTSGSMTDDDYDTSSGATDPPVESTASPVDPTDGTSGSMTDDDYDTSSGATDPPTQPTDTPAVPSSECTGTPVESYGQCGGENWTGSTCCKEGHDCVVMGTGGSYSECRPTIMPGGSDGDY